MFPYYFYSKNIDLTLVFGWDKGLLTFLSLTIFNHWQFKEEIFNTIYLPHLVRVDMGLLNYHSSRLQKARQPFITQPKSSRCFTEAQSNMTSPSPSDLCVFHY